MQQCISKRTLIPFTLSVAALLFAVLYVSPVRAEDNDLYQKEVKPLLKTKCVSCHGPLKQEAGLRLDTGELVRKGSENGQVVDLDDPVQSELLRRIASTEEFERMPPEGEQVTASQQEAIRKWIAAGAHSLASEKPLTDPSSHWAFQPLQTEFSPQSIDEFIEARLESNDLQFAERAGDVDLVRRLYLDMHGLPPSIEQIDAYASDPAKENWSRLVDNVLSSPRYGERWAQHWLDVVRYADTHGFEVNTPRENAWPYRDYVIRAFNDDKPYDQFVREQLAGDAYEEDAATGFLVASAVLLPGQIGKDDASIRLARQDSIDEIIVGTGGTFLGLTIGCARCHDHKFDPVSQQDYYTLQAFFAGVYYGDRVIRDEAYRHRVAEKAKVRNQLNSVEAELAKLESVADTRDVVIIDDEDERFIELLQQKNGHGTNPEGKQRGYRDDVGDHQRLPNLSRSRYTWWNNTSGVDVFTYRPGVEGKYRLWISWGVHGSGVHTRDARYVLDIDGDLTTKEDQQEVARADQYYPAYVTTGETEQAPQWSGLFDAGVHEWTAASKLIVRGGETGTGITADVIVLQASTESAADQTRLKLRQPVSPLKNVERFPPTKAKFVRFTSLETIDDNKHEPCLDELEVYTAGENPVNVALAERGGVPTSSGNYSNTGRHQLPHINDGQYGNERSWISNEQGKGWVQVEFAEPHVVDRVVWGRDRNGKFPDRLAIHYRIELSVDGENWTTVATDNDRLPMGTPFDELALRIRNASDEAGNNVTTLIEQVASLNKQLEELGQHQQVYGGVFRDPEETFVLRRGDPEQRISPVGPAVPEFFGAIDANLESEQDRRLALANWITRPEHPLTARVMVNRIWQHHFGQGLVNTPSDFGLNGSPPSHPLLLDWLATQFIQSGWSVKHIHRLILNSRTYQQSSAVNAIAAQKDADCRLLWRFPSHRIEAETIRDSMLAVSGQLNLTMYGSGFNFFKTRGGLSGFPPVEEFSPNEMRRMIYAHKVRMESVPVFGAFDCPDAGQSMPKRSQSTTAIQALNLFNSDFVLQQAAALAARVQQESSSDAEAQVQRTFRLTLGRAPSSSELATSAEVVKEYDLATLCRVLFNSNEFLFIP
ncbi:MAG: DUF1553 domain-containing protein [Planctomycetaceae bacterium]